MFVLKSFTSLTNFLLLSYELFYLSVVRYYINYKLMKKLLKQYVQQTQIGGKDCEQVLKQLSRILDDQVCRE